MKSTRLIAILAATALGATLTGCGEDDEPTVQNPPAAEQTSTATEAPTDTEPTTAESSDESPSTEAPAAPSDESPSTEASAEPSDDAPTSETPEPPDETPAGDLPTEPTAYGDLFVQAWADRDQGLLEQLAGPDVLTNMELWGGQGWSQVDVIEEEHNALIIQYVDEQNMELEIWVQGSITANGEPHGVVAASVTEGSYPIPDTVEDYAMAFVDAAGGDAQDREYLERLGTPAAAAEAQDWVRDFVWTIPEVSEGEDGTALVTFSSQDGVEMVLEVDRDLAESASEDAVLSVRPEGGPQH